MRGFITQGVILVLAVLVFGGSYIAYKTRPIETVPVEEFGGPLRVITVEQGGTGTSTNPSMGDVLVGLSDGTYAPRATSTLGINGSGSGSVSDWQQISGALTPTTTIGIRVKSSSTVTDLTVDGNSTTTGLLIVQGTGTSTIAGGLNLGLNKHIVAHGAVADGSDGFHIDASNGTQVVNFGAGGGSNATFSGGVNIDGTTRLATSITGVLQAVSGTVSATASPTFTNATATSLFVSSANITNATTTNFTVTTWFNFLGDIITSVSTWFDSKIEALTDVVLQGVWDFGGVTSLEIPNGTNPTVDTIGEIALDTSDNQMLIATSSIPSVIRTKEEVYKFSIPSTSPSFATGTTKYLPRLSDGYYIDEIWCGVEGGTSKVITIYGSNVTCTTGNGATTSANIFSVSAGSTTVGITASTTVGVVNWVNVTITGRWVRE